MAVWLAVLSILSYAGAADPATRPALRYVDYRHGFSLSPPLGAQRLRAPSPSRLVSWRMRDAETNAIRWTLSVHRAVEGEPVVDLAAHAKLLAARLKRGENFDVKAAEVVDHRDGKAIELRGVSPGRARFYQRQLWVPADKRRFIFLKLTGPAGQREVLNGVFDAVAATFEVVDPATAAQQRQARLDRGRTLLDKLDTERVLTAVHAEPRWFLMRRGDAAVGFLRIVEETETRGGVRGVHIETWAYVRVAERPPRRVRRELFAAADRSAEKWIERAWVGRDDGRPRRAYAISATMADDIIACTVTRHGDRGPQSKRVEREIPPGNVGLYLPQAFVELLPRLVERDAPVAWALATYNAAANGFDMHTFAVAGPDDIEIDGEMVTATRCMEQRAADRTGATVWLDETGLPLRIVDAGGLITEATDKASVLKAFGRAERIVAEMGGD
ncbi:MAG: hypothetical protein KGY99_00330 [Phycisphaerae bacterium]|nr:hypothetical protein [Phycisphaerae bacterium]